MKRPALEIQAFRAVMGKLGSLAAQIYPAFGIKDEFAEIVAYEDALLKNAVELLDGEGKHVSLTERRLLQTYYLGNYYIFVSPNRSCDVNSPGSLGHRLVDGFSPRQLLLQRRLQVQ